MPARSGGTDYGAVAIAGLFQTADVRLKRCNAPLQRLLRHIEGAGGAPAFDVGFKLQFPVGQHGVGNAVKALQNDVIALMIYTPLEALLRAFGEAGHRVLRDGPGDGAVFQPR